MNNENTEKLYADFPILFRNKDNREVACFQYGIECGDGWYDMIRGTCEWLENCLRTLPEDRRFFASQIKQKFGGLRFYVTSSQNYSLPDNVFSFLLEVETSSYMVCEVCGVTDGVKQTEGGFIRSLCAEHINQEWEGEW